MPRGPLYVDPDASEKVKRRRTAHCVLHPHSKAYITWDIFVAFLILWNVFYMPISITFPDDIRKYIPITFTIGECEDNSCEFHIESIFEAISDTVFIIDILVCCRTIIVEEVKGHTVEISDSHVIFRRYLTGFLIVDILGVGLPFADFWRHHLSNDFDRYARYFAAINLFKIFRIAKLNVIFNRFVNVPPSRQGCLQTAKMVLYLAIMTNLGSCLFFYVACDNFSYANPDSWIGNSDLINAPFEDKYLTGFYFTLFTMMSIGYGSPAPALNVAEILGTLIIMVAGVLFFSVLAGNFISIAHGLDIGSNEFSNQLYDMHVFAKTRNLPQKLRDTLKTSIKLTTNINQTSCNPKEFLADVPTALQRMMFEQTRTEQLMQARIFIPCSYSFVKAVSRQMSTQVYPMGSYVTHAGDINNTTNTLIILRSGEAQIFGFDEKTVIGNVTGSKDGSQAVGLANGFIENVRRLFSVFALSNIECFSIECKQLRHLFLTHRDALPPVLEHVIEDIRMRFVQARDNLPIFESRTTYKRYHAEDAQTMESLSATGEGPGQLVSHHSNNGVRLMRGYKLAVRVEQARHIDKLGGRLRAMDADPDVYVVVQLLDSNEKTQLRYDTSNPIWEQLLVIESFAHADPNDTLFIDIMEANFFFCRHVRLARFCVRVSDIRKNGRIDDAWYKLTSAPRLSKTMQTVVPLDQAGSESILVPSTSGDEPALRLSMRVIGSFFREDQRELEILRCIKRLEKKRDEAIRSAQIYTNWLGGKRARAVTHASLDGEDPNNVKA